MPQSDPRRDPLRAFDAHAGAFIVASGRSLDLGARLAANDITVLAGLAGALAASLADWARRLEGLDLARRGAFDEPAPLACFWRACSTTC